MREFTGQYAIIPELTQGALQRYVKQHIPTGGFLRAVLKNDLFGAMSKADESNQAALHAICMYVYNEMPCNCWGNEETINAWLEVDK